MGRVDLRLRMAAAEATWLAISQPCDGVAGSGGGLTFRCYGRIAAALRFAPDSIDLQRVETLAPGEGGFRVFLARLTALAEDQRIPIRGNARAYATAQTPRPDQARLLSAYVAAGFDVGDGPLFAMRYEPRASKPSRAGAGQHPSAAP